MRATGLRGGKHADPSVRSPPLRRSPCSSIRKGVPLYGWKNRGEAPRRWLLSEQRLAGFRPSPGAAHAQAVPPTQASLGATGPTLEISGGVHKVPGLGPGPRKPSLHRTGRRVFPRTILFSRSPTPAEAECPGKTWAPGAGARGRPRFHARWRWTGRAGRRPLDEFSLGTQACSLLRG